MRGENVPLKRPKVVLLMSNSAPGLRCARQTKVRAVQHIEGFDAQLQASRFGHLNVLDDRSVPVQIERAIDERAFQRSGLTGAVIEKRLSGERR